MAAALGGYVLKLCIYAVLIVLLADSDAIDGSSLAVTSAILLVAALVWQTRWALRDARLFWVTTSGHASASRSTHDVVYTSGWRSSHRSSDPRSTERTPG
jgi:hypothetical protein